MKINKAQHITKTGVVKTNPFGRKISRENYEYAMEVLPPLTWGVEETIDFLGMRDHNPEMIEKIIKSNAKGCFMQGEGYDFHDIYVMTKDGQYWRIGKTKNRWNTEIFRYNDWRKMTPEELERYNM